MPDYIMDDPGRSVNINNVEGDVYILAQGQFPTVSTPGEPSGIGYSAPYYPGASPSYTSNKAMVQESVDAMVEVVNILGEESNFKLANALLDNYLKGVAMGAIAYVNALKQKQFDDDLKSQMVRSAQLPKASLIPQPKDPQILARFSFIPRSGQSVESVTQKFSELYSSRYSEYSPVVTPVGPLIPGSLPSRAISVVIPQSKSVFFVDLSQIADKDSRIDADVFVSFYPIDGQETSYSNQNTVFLTPSGQASPITILPFTPVESGMPVKGGAGGLVNLTVGNILETNPLPVLENDPYAYESANDDPIDFGDETDCSGCMNSKDALYWFTHNCFECLPKAR